MKGSKRTFAKSLMKRVHSCIFLPDSYNMKKVDNRWVKRLRTVKLDDYMFLDE